MNKGWEKGGEGVRGFQLNCGASGPCDRGEGRGKPFGLTVRHAHTAGLVMNKSITEVFRIDNFPFDSRVHQQWRHSELKNSTKNPAI